LDSSNFDEWAKNRRPPPGLALEGSKSLWPYIRRNMLRPVKRHGVNTLLWLIGEYRKGIEDALDVRLYELLLPVPGLDPRLDGLSILHITDLHLGVLDGIEEAVTAAVTGVEADLCVLTGDYAPRYGQRTERVAKGVQRILAGATAKHGVYATLGNYDSANLARQLMEGGICNLLVNRQVRLEVNGVAVEITGTDDPYDQDHGPILAALAEPGEGFRIALVHTPDMAAEAAAGGFDLYLCGHTHGGQICLPGGKPVITNCKRRSDLATGLWREGGMWGYTSRGAGVSSIGRRHNCPPEVTLIRLVAGGPV
jgi:predicted MPP superfamily phosphohydrolase